MKWKTICDVDCWLGVVWQIMLKVFKCYRNLRDSHAIWWTERNATSKHLMVKTHPSYLTQTVKFSFPEHIPVSSFSLQDIFYVGFIIFLRRITYGDVNMCIDFLKPNLKEKLIWRLNANWFSSSSSCVITNLRNYELHPHHQLRPSSIINMQWKISF